MEGDMSQSAANGRVKPNWVLVNGRPEKYEAGIYYLDWRENGKHQCLLPKAGLQQTRHQI
ncbi:hypothetical protein HDF09_001799 [Edaphobacter lichenicola]|uniref:Uncharacterized protein n=1 Tax=Tunturiibacter empetritectus TaxID=3069691 RepID=A0A7W8IIT4_9BACT|nr:hypothetical protein [Edaphobacter lichenicola]